MGGVPESTGSVFVAGWLRGRFGAVEEVGCGGGGRRWRVLRSSGPAFDVEVSEEALKRERIHLREWLEQVAEDAARSAPATPGGYRVSAAHGVLKATGSLAGPASEWAGV